MRKKAAYLSMGGIVLALLGADYFVVTSGESISRLVAARLEEMAKGAVRWDQVTASMDGVVTVEGVKFTDVDLEAERVKIRLNSLLDAVPEAVELEGVKFRLTDKLFDDLSKDEGADDWFQDLFKDPAQIPSVVLTRGTIEALLPAVFAEGAQELRVNRLSVSPIGGRRVHVEGDFESDLFGAWRASGEIDLGTGVHRMTIESKGFEFRPEMRAPLAPNLRSIYDRYLPGGRCDVAIRFGRDAEGKSDFRVTLTARDLSITYVNFPYRVEGVEGEIDFLTDGFRIKHMTGWRGSTVFRFDGVGGGYGAESGYALRLEIDAMPLDDELREALTPETQGVWDLFQPTGMASARGRVVRESGLDKDPRIPLDVTFHGASMKYKKFPYLIRNLEGTIHVDGNDVVVKRLTAREGETTFEFTGAISDITGDPDVNVDVVARRLTLDDRLRDALDKKTKETWDLFSPGGPVDLWWNVSREKGKKEVQTGRVHGLGNTALYQDVPLPASGVTGVLELGPKGVRIHRVTGMAHGARVQISGWVDDEVVRLDELDVVGLPLDEKVKKALPKDVGDLIRQLRLGGVVNLQSSLTMPRDGSDKDVTLHLSLSEGTLDTDPRFEGMQGTVILTGTLGKENLLMGPVSFSQTRFWGKDLTDLTASLRVKGRWVTFQNIKATAYDGVVAGDVSINTYTGDIEGAFTADRVDIREYARDTRSYAEKQLSGRVSLRLEEFRGNLKDSKTMRGTGRLAIREASLWNVPVFASLVLLNPQDLFTKKNEFDAGAVEFDIEGSTIKINDLAFTSPSINVVGRGRIEFGGEMNLILRPKADRFLGIDFFLLDLVTEPLGWLKDQFYGVEVTGTFDEPVVTQKLFPGSK